MFISFFATEKKNELFSHFYLMNLLVDYENCQQN